MNGSLMTTEQVSERLALPVSSVYRLIRQRELAAHNVGTRLRPMYRVSEEQLDQFLDARLASSA